MFVCLRIIKSMTILTLLFSTAKVAGAIIDPTPLPCLARKVKLDDISQTFTSEYSTVESCPEKIKVFSKPLALDGNIAEMNVSNIEEDGETCRGSLSSKFTIVPEYILDHGSFLRRQGFSETFFALKNNSAAGFLLKRNKSVLLGFIPGGRTCGELFYPENTFWLFSKMPRNENQIPVSIEGMGNTKILTVPPSTTALVVSDGKSKVLKQKAIENLERRRYV